MKAMLINGAWRLLGALIGLVLGGGLAVFLGDAIAEALNISNFEGGRGYFIAFALLPLFALVGALLGAIMIYLRWRGNAAIGLTLLVVLGIFLFSQRAQFIPLPPQVETLGNFELLTYSSKHMGDYYQLRYRGEPLPIKGRAGMFGDDSATYQSLNSIITFTLPLSITAPVFVVNVGDPNNTSFFYLVREMDGQAKVEYLSDTSANVAADWLDVAPSDPSAPRDLTLHRGRLTGGRWLLLGDNCVLDVQTLTAYRFDTYPLQDGADAALNQSKLPLGLSPDQHSLVRVGESDVRDWGTQDYRGTVARLIVFDFVDGSSYTLAVDRSLMRYPAVETLDGAWLDHHFVWAQTPGGHERLIQRSDFSPLPYRGLLTGEGQDQAYKLAPVKPELIDKLAGFLIHEFNAVNLATRKDESSTYIDLQISEQHITLGYASDGYSPPSLGVWLDWQADQDGQVVAEIAQRFDEVLRTGVYDGLFLGDPVAITAPVIEGLQQFRDLSQEHTTEAVTYAQTPPVGGKHHDQWLNCGVYTESLQNELAVHSLEHGAVWITYQPTLPADQIATLQALTKAGDYRLLSPYPGLPSPIVVSAWGLQVKLENADDSRLATFINAYANRPDGPEYGAPCTGGVGEPAQP